MRYAIIEKSSDECVKFLHLTVVDAPVAQLDRVSDSDSEGRAFESHRAYQARGEQFAHPSLFCIQDFGPVLIAALPFPHKHASVFYPFYIPSQRHPSLIVGVSLFYCSLSDPKNPAPQTSSFDPEGVLFFVFFLNRSQKSSILKK